MNGAVRVPRVFRAISCDVVFNLLLGFGDISRNRQNGDLKLPETNEGIVVCQKGGTTVVRGVGIAFQR